MLAVGDKGKQLVEQFLARHGIKACSGFVQNEQLGIVAECAGKLQLHAHAAGKVLDLCLGIEAKLAEEVGEGAMAPGGVRRAYECLNFGHLECGREGACVQHEADTSAQAALRFIGRAGATALPKQVHLAGIELYKPESSSNGRRLAGAICAHKADDLAGLHSERDITQRKRSLTRREMPLSSKRFCMV